MARPLRIEYPGAVYHIIQRGTERKAIFRSDLDKERFLRYLEEAHTRYRSICHCYTLMDNHYHLIMETPESNLSKIMHYLDGSYAAYFNAKRKRVGPLYQGRYKAILVQADEYLHHLSRYIHLNPVRAKIAKDPAQYKWTSYNYYTSSIKKPEWLTISFILSMFDIKELNGKRSYKKFILDERIESKKIIKENTHKGFVIGDMNFFKKLVAKHIKDRDDPEIPKIREIYRTREPEMEEIEKKTKERVKSNNKLARKVSIYLTRKYTQNKLRDIASYFGNIRDAGVSILYKRVEKERRGDKCFNKLILLIEKALNVET